MAKPMTAAQVRFPPDMYEWIKSRADCGFRSIPSVVLEIVQEKMMDDEASKWGRHEKGGKSEA